MLCLGQPWGGRLHRTQQLMLWMLWIALLRMTDPLGGIIPSFSPQEPYSCLLGEQEPGLDPPLQSQGSLESLGAQLHGRSLGKHSTRRGEVVLCAGIWAGFP